MAMKRIFNIVLYRINDILFVLLDDEAILIEYVFVLGINIHKIIVKSNLTRLNSGEEDFTILRRQ